MTSPLSNARATCRSARHTATRGGYAGRGPKGYTRSDERIREDVCDRLSWNDEVDATDITVRVQSGEVTLEGSVETRRMKRLAEDIAEDVPGVLTADTRIGSGAARTRRAAPRRTDASCRCVAHPCRYCYVSRLAQASSSA